MPRGRGQMRVWCTDGGFDLFHAGHVEILKNARQLGDFTSGVYTDQTVSQQRGAHFPLMHLHERSLSVLACRYVDESLLAHLGNLKRHGHGRSYKVPKSMGIFRTLESPKNITTTSVAERIKANHEILPEEKC
uniref:ethanolamine-phosphate cytidylyltransferase n=1 Tax=Helianthus annuus TaxID=4232 RepID=A0A251T2S7_HELAN